MGLEAATYIHQLNPLNPVGAVDAKAQGDDHIRMVKSTLQATFPSITGPVTVTHTQINNAVGSGLTGFAAPSVSVKGSGAANAGVATTALRSDARLIVDLADIFSWTGQHSWTTALKIPNGVVGTPAIHFSSDPDTGFYSLGANQIGLAVGGLLNCYFDLGHMLGDDGTVARPYFSFFNDTDTGIYSGGANNLRVSTGGGLRWQFTNTFNETFVPQYFPDGAAGAPSVTFGSDPDTGMFRGGANDLRFACGGTTLFILNANFFQSLAQQMANVDGSAATPAYGFSSDGNTGLYSRGADRLGFAEGGTGYDVGYRNIPQNSQSANYGLVQSDSGKHILHPNGAGAGDTYTIPANASVAYEIGTVLTFVNRDSNNLTIAITSDTLILAGTTSTGSRTLGQNGVATAIKVESTVWIISGTGIS